MSTVYSRSGSPVFRLLVSFPIACFSAAFVTDVVYVVSARIMWADFSDWLLAGGIAVGVLAAIVGIADAASRRRVLPRRPVLPLAIGGLVVLLLAFLDNLVHSRDAWTSVVPEGIALSAVIVLVMLITAWADAAAVSRARLRYAEMVA
jgi:uncharacterized membrane protein